MDARSYLEQAPRLALTVELMQERLNEHRAALDMLRSASLDGMPKGGSDPKKLETAIAEYEELADAYVGELLRWTALRRQAIDMLDRARAVLTDGGAHAITLTHIDVLEAHYFGERLPYTAERYGDRTVASVLHLSERTVERYAHDALEWLDYSRDLAGMPMVPICSE